MRRWIFFFISLAFVLASLSPVFYELSQRDKLQPNRSFELVHNFYTDYNFYLSRIRLGLEGNKTVVEKYTSEPHQGSYIQVFYLALGWIGKWVRVRWEEPGNVYHVARVVLGMTLLLLIAHLAKKSMQEMMLSTKALLFKAKAAEVANRNFDPSSVATAFSASRQSLRASEAGQNFIGSPQLWLRWQILAFLLAVTASTWPKIVQVGSSWRFGGYMAWWSVMDSLQRLTFIPHILAGQALVLFLLMALSDHEVLKKERNWLFLGFLGLILGVIFPPGLIFVYAGAILLIILDWIFDSRGWRVILRVSWIVRYIASRGIFVALSAPALIYLQTQLAVYPWRRLAEFDIINPLPFQYLEYFKAVGYVLPLGLAGLLMALWRKEKTMITSIAWVAAWGLLLYVFKFVPSQSPLRFSEMAPQIPLAILTTYLFYNCYNYYKNYKRYIFLFPPIALIILGLGIMYSSWLWQRDFVDHKVRAAYPLVPFDSYVMYPLKDFMSALGYLRGWTPRESIVLSLKTAGNYIPVYGGNTVYLGHANTVRLEEKEMVTQSFFAGRLQQKTVSRWLSENKVAYVFFGPQEREAGGIIDLSTIYPFLKSIYTNDQVVIYQVFEN